MRPQIVKWMFGTSLALLLAAPCLAQEDFANVEYYKGPSARQSHQKVAGEVFAGTLRFDDAEKQMTFTSPEGEGFTIPYSSIKAIRYETDSHARQGSWAIGAGAGALFIREKRHFLLLRYTNDKGENRSALLHLDKSNYKDVTKTAEKETGIKAEKAD